MKLLQEEFFGKIWKFIKELKITPIRIILKLLFYLLILVILLFFVWMIYAKRYSWIVIFIGVFVLGEVAHFIRKSREKAMNKIIETKNDIKDETENTLNKDGMVLNERKKIDEEKVKKVFKERVLNKEGLLSKKS